MGRAAAPLAPPINTLLGKRQYLQKFRPKWLKQNNIFDWLKNVAKDLTKRYCKFCYCTVQARQADLTYVETKKHIMSVAGAVRFHSSEKNKINFEPPIKLN